MTDDELCKSEFEKWFLLDEAVSDKHIKWCAWKTAWKIRPIPQPEAAKVEDLDADTRAGLALNDLSELVYLATKACQVDDDYKLVEVCEKTVKRALQTAPKDVPDDMVMAPNDEETVGYIARYGGGTRCDCENAVSAEICDSGLPCGDSKKAIRHVLKALNYGLRNGYIKAASPAVADKE